MLEIPGLPPRHPMGLLDWVFGAFLICLTCAFLSSPLTPRWRMVRAAFAGPAIALGWVYLAFVPLNLNDEDQWGTTILMCEFMYTHLAH